MAKFQSPLLGYNNNVRHKNRVFHIQTEDSGVNHPHIITHLFMDGGRILKSMKKSYAEYVGVEGMSDTVRGIMKEQHKAMFIALRDGQFDYLVDGGAAPAPKSAATPSQAPPAAPAVAAAPAIAPEAPAPASAQPSPVLDASPTTEDAGAAVSVAPVTTAEPPRVERLDENAPAERGPPTVVTSSFRFQTADLPPPPKNLFSKKEPGTGGAYRAVDVEPRRDPREEAVARVDPREEPSPRAAARRVPPAPSSSSSRMERGSQPSHTAVPRSPASRSAEARYAPARPAAIFGGTQRPPPASLFSDDLVSDKSLDEVILSYLAEDLEPPRRK
jgi:hypothetical protein